MLEVEGPAVPGFVYSNNFSRHNTVRGQRDKPRGPAPTR